MNNENRKIQLDDIARDLGLSKSTVSRAISGKGRISQETTARVQEYIRIHDYRPNLIARSLAESKSYNIGVVLPTDSDIIEIPFFQRALMGICESASREDYDVVVITSDTNNISQLERVVMNRKVDGVVLTRPVQNDISIDYLEQKNVPFVIIGSHENREICQIDTDHVSACCELTSYILGKSLKKTAFLIGNTRFNVNNARLNGFMKAYSNAGLTPDSKLIFTDLLSPSAISVATAEAVKCGAECIITADDYICTHVLLQLRNMNVAIPDKIKVASCYNSVILQSNQPTITAIDIDVAALGVKAGQRLLDLIGGKDVRTKILSNYEIVLKKSTS